MDIRTVTTFLRDKHLDGGTIGTAAAIAEAQSAHLSAVCLGIDRTDPGFYYGGANAIAMQSSLQEAQADAAATEAAAATALGPWTIPWETCAITAQIGTIAQVVGEQAMLSDLIVLPLPYGEGRGVEDVVVTEAALFRTRVPVLAIPPGFDRNVAPRSVVIAWNESAEALAAIRAAMPFLRGARDVDIAIVDPPPHRADRSDSGGPLAEMLSRHDVRANVTILAKTLTRISDVLARHCADRSADLLVMGAYGHARIREAILGGATRNTLEKSAIPVLMAR